MHWHHRRVARFGDAIEVSEMFSRFFLPPFGRKVAACDDRSHTNRSMTKRFLLLLLPCVLLCPALRASTYTAASCSSSDFATAIASAADGDTVQGPSGGGSGTWSSSITIGKGIALNLNGCVITFSGAVLTINADATPFSMTGGTFNNCGASNGSIDVNYGSGDAVWRIYNNTFNVTGTCILPQGVSAGGLIDHNTLATSGSATEMIHIYGGNAGSTQGWTVDITPGGPNMLYLENNVFTESSTSNFALAEEAFYGAAFVLRDNTLNYVQGDAHGSGQYGPETRWAEIYNNTYNNCCASSSFYDFRGGTGVIFGNTANNTRSGTRITIGPMCGSSDSCDPFPMKYGFGMGVAGTNESPFYMWGTGAVETSTPQNNDPTLVAIGATVSSCSGLTGSLCSAIIATTQPATMERCESAADVAQGCPVSYSYTPYSYPHPSDNCSPTQQGAGAACGGPAPPSALSGNVQTQ